MASHGDGAKKISALQTPSKAESHPHTRQNAPHKEITPDLYTGEPPLQSAHNTWKQVKTDLAYALGPNVHRSWTARLHITQADESVVTLSAPTKFIASKIETNFADTVRRLWEKHDQVDPPRRVGFAANPSRKAAQMPSRTQGQQGQAQEQAHDRIVGTRQGANAALPPLSPSPSILAHPVTDPAHTAPNDSPRERFTFENFVVGPSNELAVAVARQVANCHAPQYNPIVIHGANGMGKTHLLYAIENFVREHHPDKRMRFITAEDFVSGFVASVRGQGRENMAGFKASLRDVDLLVIDDAHFIANKPGSQEELLHTLVSLVDNGKQILIAADRHPEKIEKATDRLKSYLCSGLVCKIGAADYELRLRILDRLIARRRQQGQSELAIPKNARDHLAARMNATPRDLEGAFNQIVAQSEFLGTAITLENVQETLSDSRYMLGQRLTVDRIQRAVCEVFSVTLTDMVSKRRARIIARPRQVAMYLCKKLTKRSLPDIGRRFGGRDHTTVMHAVKRIDSLRADDPAFSAQIDAVEALLKG